MNGACYSYVPRVDSTAPRPGERIALQVSDQGRVDLGDQLGPGVDRVEGTLVSVDDGQYVMSVASVQNVRHQTSHWSGERVPIRKANVTRLEQRRFSIARTSLAVGGAALAVALLVSTHALESIGLIGDRGGEGGPPPESLRP
jgi:hypothetical protein